MNSPPAFPPVRRREIFGWCCFDFANSAFTTVIISVVYLPYFRRVVAEGDSRAAVWWGTALGASQLLVIFLSPLIGTIADFTARKKMFLMTTCVVCSMATAGLYFVGAGEVPLALALVIVANVAFSLSENLCAAFLPEISTPENTGRISGFGWSFGYLGGLLSLLGAYWLIKSGEGRVPATFVMTALFFLVASLPTLLLLRERAQPRSAPVAHYRTLGTAQITGMFRELPQHRTLLAFFAAMTLYLAGLTAVVAFASDFAQQVVHMTMDQALLLFVVMQVAGVAGAFGFGLWQDRVGSKPVLIAALTLWIIACGWAGFCQSAGEFYAITMIAGLALGSLQSAGRAVVSALTPSGRAGEFFGYWGFFGKLAAVIGQPVFGVLVTAFGYRPAIIANAGFFLVGLLIVLRIQFDQPSRRPRSAAA